MFYWWDDWVADAFNLIQYLTIQFKASVDHIAVGWFLYFWQLVGNVEEFIFVQHMQWTTVGVSLRHLTNVDETQWLLKPEIWYDLSDKEKQQTEMIALIILQLLFHLLPQSKEIDIIWSDYNSLDCCKNQVDKTREREKENRR